MATYRVLFDLWEHAEQLLREGTTVVYPILTKPELREFAATARALAAGAEAEIEARPAPFPASLRPALVMQWLPLREVAAALRVASSWRDESEQYFRRFAQYHGLIRLDSWQDSVRCYMKWYRYGGFTSIQRAVFAYYAKFWAKGDTRFISIGEVALTWRYDKEKYSFPPRRAYAETVRRSVVFLVCFGKLNTSPTSRGHRFDFQADLTPLQLRVLKYHISNRVYYDDIRKLAADLDIYLSQAQTTVEFLVSAGHLSAPVDGNPAEFCERFLSGLTPLWRDVLDYYTQHATSDVGLATNAVAASLVVNLARLRAAVAFLSRKDYLYSTIDEDHHKSNI